MPLRNVCVFSRLDLCACFFLPHFLPSSACSMHIRRPMVRHGNDGILSAPILWLKSNGNLLIAERDSHHSWLALFQQQRRISAIPCPTCANESNILSVRRYTWEQIEIKTVAQLSVCSTFGWGFFRCLAAFSAKLFSCSTFCVSLQVSQAS